MLQVYKTEDGPTKNATEEAPVLQARSIMPSMTHDGTSVNTAKPAKQFLHLSAFLCARCNGPVIAGSPGTREDDISGENDVRKTGAVCLACGFRPEIAAERSVRHHFHPLTWDWVIQSHAGPLLAKLVQPPDACSKLSSSAIKDGVEV